MKTYKSRTLEQAATVALETAVQDAIGVLRMGCLLDPLILEAERILLAAAVTAESLLGRTDG